MSDQHVLNGQIRAINARWRDEPSFPPAGRNPDPPGRRDRHAGVRAHGLCADSRDPHRGAAPALVQWRPAPYELKLHRLAAPSLVCFDGAPIAGARCGGVAHVDATARGSEATWHDWPCCVDCLNEVRG